MLQVRSGDGIVYLNLDDDLYSCAYEVAQIIDLSSVDAATSDQTAFSPAQATRWMDLPVDGDPRPKISDLIRFCHALLRAALSFRNKRVRDLCCAINCLDLPSNKCDTDYHQASLRFRQLISLLPRRPECLFESFFFLHFLRLYGYRADWIFGVHLFPFRAHCWITKDGTLLNESHHNIESYEVIYSASYQER